MFDFFLCVFFAISDTTGMKVFFFFLNFIVVFSIFSCKKKVVLPKLDLIEISANKNKVYITPLSGQGLSPIEYSLKGAVNEEMITFFLGKKRVYEASMLNDPRFGIVGCQFVKSGETTVGSSCLLDLGLLDSALDSGLERKSIIYVNSKDEYELKKKITWQNFLPSYLVLLKGGPFLRLESRGFFLIENEKTVLQQAFYVISPIEGRLKNRKKIVLGVNRGNFLSMVGFWPEKKKKWKKEGLDCSFDEGLNGRFSCTVRHAKKLTTVGHTPIHLKVRRHKKETIYQVFIKGEQKKDGKKNHPKK